MMRTFIPFNSVRMNAEILDEITLAAQCNQSIAILRTLLGKAKGWGWHPGVVMWKGHEVLLAEQAHAYVRVFDTLYPNVPKGSAGTFAPQLLALGFQRNVHATEMPWWWGHTRFHDGNKSALLRTNHDWYGQFFPGVAIDMCDWWPRGMEINSFAYGPQPAPDGAGFDYEVRGKPVYKPVDKMSGLEFANHANRFHNLTPDIKSGVSPSMSDDLRRILAALHDRFHRLNVYGSHDHS